MFSGSFWLKLLCFVVIGSAIQSCRCEDKNETISFKWPKDRRCREAKITSARMPFFVGAWQAVGAKDDEIDGLKADFNKLAKESCDEPGKFFDDLPSAGQITAKIEEIDKRNIEVFGTDLRVAIFFRDGIFSLFREAFEKKCKPTYSNNFLELDSASFESKFASIAVGSCDSNSSGDQDVLGAGGILSSGFNNSFRACFDELMENVNKDEECVDPLAEGADSSSTPTADDCKPPGCTEATDSEGNVTRTETDDKGNTTTTITKTKTNGDKTVNQTVTDKDGKKLSENNMIVVKNSKGGTTTQASSKEYNEDGSVKKEIEAISVTDASGKVIDWSYSCKGCSGELEPDDLKIAGQSIGAVAGIVGGIATGNPWAVAAGIGSGLVAAGSIWEKIKDNKKLCPSITPVENATLPYLVSNFGDAGFPTEPAAKQGLPTILDSLNYCLCQAGSGSLANLKCHSKEDQDRMECLRNPWGPDDAPRKECLDLLAEDNKELMERIKGKVCNAVYCPADSYLIVSNKAISGSTGPTYERSCTCLSKKAVAGQPLKNCNSLNCGPDSYCDCSGFMCTCQSFGGGGISSMPGFFSPSLTPPPPILVPFIP